jgi:hypothetical protein
LGADSPSPEPNMMNVIKALGMFATIMTKSNNFFASNREEMIDKLVAFFGARDVTIDKEPLLNAKSKDEFMDALQKQINSSGFMAANMNFPDAHFSTETSTEKSSEESPVAEQSDKE